MSQVYLKLDHKSGRVVQRFSSFDEVVAKFPGYVRGGKYRAQVEKTWFEDNAVPLSDELWLIELFRPTSNGIKTILCPETLTEPLEHKCQCGCGITLIGFRHSHYCDLFKLSL